MYKSLAIKQLQTFQRELRKLRTKLDGPKESALSAKHVSAAISSLQAALDHYGKKVTEAAKEEEVASKADEPVAKKKTQPKKKKLDFGD